MADLAAQSGGRCLAEAMARQGHTQRALAEALGVAQQTVSRWLHGAVAPGLLHQLRLRRLYDVPLSAWGTQISADDARDLEALADPTPPPEVA
ncbi:MAG: helix-turn-helix domain-containing protein [Burkholderiales bacterium]|nr:helix-turn-helix domain-containing protein [Burkholderiales bacterium]